MTIILNILLGTTLPACIALAIRWLVIARRPDDSEYTGEPDYPYSDIQ